MDEEQALETLAQELNICKMLDDRETRNGTVYALLAQELAKLGYEREPKKIQQKWQSLKRTHNAGKAARKPSGAGACQTDDILADILDSRPSARLIGHGIDTAAYNLADGSIEGNGHFIT